MKTGYWYMYAHEIIIHLCTKSTRLYGIQMEVFFSIGQTKCILFFKHIHDFDIVYSNMHKITPRAKDL